MTDSPTEQLGDAISVGLADIMPQASNEVREEIKVYLVDYFKNHG